jgi:hypothetical protein
MATEKTTSSRKPTSKRPSTPGERKPAGEGGGSDKERSSAPRAAAPKRAGATLVAAEAARQLLELTGKAAEGVTGLERTDEGWKVQVEVVEVRRIPNTTDVLALYEVTVSPDGDLEGYRRLRRYIRGAPGEN